MPKKIKEETTENVNETEATEASAAESNTDAAKEDATESNNEDTQSSVIDSVIETVSAAVGSVAESVSNVVSSVTGSTAEQPKTSEAVRKRAEKVGIVASDKMTKTVVVRVDRQVKHPIYRKYIKRRKKFMAHDELGSAVGDRVRIVETRPLSAHKRWRVVEILQKAEK